MKSSEKVKVFGYVLLTFSNMQSHIQKKKKKTHKIVKERQRVTRIAWVIYFRVQLHLICLNRTVRLSQIRRRGKTEKKAEIYRNTKPMKERQ